MKKHALKHEQVKNSSESNVNYEYHFPLSESGFSSLEEVKAEAKSIWSSIDVTIRSQGGDKTRFFVAVVSPARFFFAGSLS
jgi:hypothetical protein